MNYPNLFDKSAVYKNHIPAHDGIGTLCHTESCTVTAVTDGTLELDMVYPASGKYAEHLFPEALLRVNLDRLYRGEESRQFFRITETEHHMTAGGEEIKIHAEHLSYDLKWQWCKPVSIQGKNIAQCVAHIRDGGMTGAIDPFLYQLDTPSTQNDFIDFSHEELFTKREGLLEIAELCGLYIEPDNLTIHLKKGGTETGAVLEKGKNLAELSVRYDSTQGVTGVYIYYQDNTDYVPPQAVAPYKGKYGVPHYTAFNYAGNHPEGQFDSPMDTDVVKLIGEAYLRNRTQPEPFITYSAKIADTGQDFSLHDIVTVVHSGFHVDQKLEVQKITYDVLRRRYTEIMAGNFEAPLSHMIAELQRKVKG